MLAARQRAPAVAQPEQRVELLDQLGRRRAAAHRADADRVARGRLARDLEDRERDVQPAAQVDVAVGLAPCRARCPAARSALISRSSSSSAPSSDSVDLVVDVLGLGRPASRRW